jgi:hypothetical protein
MHKLVFVLVTAAIASILSVASQQALSQPTRASARTSVPSWVGKTVLLQSRTKTRGCKRGANPDRRCSPGAYYSKLTRAVICSASFRTDTIRDVSQNEKFALEREYGMKASYYGRTMEIDHIVSLELGGSNNIANLFPEFANARPAGYHVKDALENRLHDRVCSGQMSLPKAQQQIAANWQKLYKQVFGQSPHN